MTPTKHEVLSEFRTATILRAASRLFAEGGFANTTVEDIARAAGVAKGTVYLYFPSKEDIYRAAFVRNIEELKERTLAALAEAGTVEGKLLAFIRTKLAYFDQHRAFFAVYFAEMSHANAPGGLQSALDASRRQQTAVLTAALEAGVEAGEVRPLPAGAAASASAVFDLTRSIAVRRMQGRSSASAEEDARAVFDLLWKGLAAS